LAGGVRLRRIDLGARRQREPARAGRTGDSQTPGRPPFRVEAAPPSPAEPAEDKPATRKSKPRAQPAPPAAAPIPIDQTDRGEVLAVIRNVFSSGGARDRETALREVAQALGYERLGPRIRDSLDRALRTAVRRGILQNEGAALSLLCRSIDQYERPFLKEQFLAALGRSWIDRAEAARVLARWLGFTRTGPTIADAARSLINGLLRERRLEARDGRIRKS